MTGVNKIVDICEEKLTQEKINTYCLYVGKQFKIFGYVEWYMVSKVTSRHIAKE